MIGPHAGHTVRSMTFAARLTKNSEPGVPGAAGALGGVLGGVQELPCGQAKWSYETPKTCLEAVSIGKGTMGSWYRLVMLFASTNTLELSVPPETAKLAPTAG